MKIFYVNSAEATKIHSDTLTQKRIGIHFANYVLSFKFLNEPLTQLKSLIAQNHLKPIASINLKVV
tara:strand:- start:313 stop:510 length:198 start_codon:yes stop_codon:yes gene_type:complete